MIKIVRWIIIILSSIGTLFGLWVVLYTGDALSLLFTGYFALVLWFIIKDKD